MRSRVSYGVGMSDVREQLEREAREAAAALPFLSDDLVERALAQAATLLRERAGAVLAANRADLEAAEGRLDAGALDRLRLADDRVQAMADQSRTLSQLLSLERRIASWTLENGLHVQERRIPIGVVGANFEARPNVAIDVAGQLLKSRNAALLRTGSAALRTVTALVDDVLRPALESAGLPPGAVGLVRSADHEGARSCRCRSSCRSSFSAAADRRPPRSRGSRRSTASARSRTRKGAASSTFTRRPTRQRRSR